MNKVDELLAKAKAASPGGQLQPGADQRGLCGVGWQLYKDDNIERLARLAVEETGYGNVPSKIVKHKRKVGGPLQDILDPRAVTVGLIERDEQTGISKYAKPVGVVCALLPATNPTATVGTNGIAILKGRNAAIFRPSSRAKKASGLAVEYMRQGLRQVGAPEDLVQCFDDADIPTTNELMGKADLVVATGGGPMVRAAYSSGTPSYGVGTGNATCIIAEDADAADAVAKITSSNTFDTPPPAPRRTRPSCTRASLRPWWMSSAGTTATSWTARSATSWPGGCGSPTRRQAGPQSGQHRPVRAEDRAPGPALPCPRTPPSWWSSAPSPRPWTSSPKRS
jgi:sulfoacetaldehyde dehydrogenase